MDPNFFIIGAPKCGTSALASYLAEHPEVYFSVPKETNFWCTDYTGLRDIARIKTLPAYLKLFAAAQPRHRAIGEGSVNYFRSEVAVRKILEFNPRARFILLLRNPLDMVYSLHQERLFQFFEDVGDFEQAWGLQEERRKGRNIPRRCVQPELLQYAQMASYAGRLEDFMKQVPASQRKIIIFDDFVAQTRQTYLDVLEFLAICDDGRILFPKVRESHSHRFGGLSYFLLRPPNVVRNPMLWIKRSMQRHAQGMWNRVRPLFVTKKPRKALRPEFREQLRVYFAPDVERVSHLLDRDLSHWVYPSGITLRS